MPELPVYNPTEIEPKWQAKWDKDGLYQANIDYNTPKYYALTMLPYTSGDFHIGHWYAMTPPDARPVQEDAGLQCHVPDWVRRLRLTC